MLRVFLCCLFWLAGPALAATPLVTPYELADWIAADAVRVVDIREAPAYALQHVPTAVSAPYGLWHGTGAQAGDVPPLADLTELVQSLGLGPDVRTVIVYAGVDATDFGGAARVYWTLKSLGMRDLAILNGGLAAWRNAGFDASDTPATAPRTQWQPQFDTRWMATRADVLADLDTPDVLLVDARPPPYFAGRVAPPQARAHGTLPGAVNLDSELFFELGSAELMEPSWLADEAERLDADPQAPIVTFCNAGHWSATDWFVLSELLGYDNVRMYPGSMVDWTNATLPLPMMNEPTRAQMLRFMVLDWLHRNAGTPAPTLG